MVRQGMEAWPAGFEAYSCVSALNFHLVHSKHPASLQQAPGALCQTAEVLGLQRSPVEGKELRARRPPKVLGDAGFILYTPPEVKCRKCIIIKNVQGMADHDVLHIKQDTERIQSWASVTEVIRFPKGHTYKVMFRIQDMAATACRQGLKALNLSLTPAQLEVEQFIPLTVCFRCYQIEGHTTKECTKPQDYKVCSICAETDHTWQECDAGEQKCVLCSGQHSCMAMKCPKRKQALKVKRARQLTRLAAQLRKQRVDIAGLSETRRPGTREISSGDYTYYCNYFFRLPIHIFGCLSLSNYSSVNQSHCLHIDSINVPIYLSVGAGVVSVRGCNIHQDTDTSVLQCPGPLARHASDLRLVLGVLAGEKASELSLGKKVNPGGVVIHSLEGDGDGVLTTGLSQDLLRVQRDVTRHYRHTYDCTVKKVKIPGLHWSYQMWRERLAEETQYDTPIYEQLADNKGEINVGTEITRWLLGRPHHTAPSLAQALLAKVSAEVQFLGDQQKVLLGREASKTPSKRKEQVEAQWKAMQMRIQRLLGDNGVLLYPSHPTQAPYHGESLFRPLNFTYAAVFNALGFPVTQVPLGLASNGLPLGIQVVGAMNKDYLTIAIAEDLEKHFGGWVCPSKIL
ncbi:uncharacterized protein LOC126997135 [Eriocheir sinensis]|uniref:uncharacterized protein LOC126997135 n=1 Tax=Eriocheir sinensis TaxID=95602 RepID=UPI0021C876DA|nr:uncharacterized protein LOC126997135 [Eriocheir sinensis]